MMQKIKKVAVVLISTLVILSALIFPALATATSNTVTWDSEFIWLKSNVVRSRLTVSEYTGLKPTTTFWATANTGETFTAKVAGTGTALSGIVETNLSIPFILDSGTTIRYNNGN